MALQKVDATTQLFDGFARVIIFKDVDPYSFTDATTLADVLKGGIDLGQITEGSPSWDGDDAELEVLKDTEGGVIRAKPTPGTMAWSCRVPSTSNAMAKTIGGGKEYDVESLGTDFEIARGKKVVGIDPGKMIQHCPIGVLNLTHNQLGLFPKATVVASLGLEDDDLMQYSLAATAEEIETTNLATMMFIPLATDPLEKIA